MIKTEVLKKIVCIWLFALYDWLQRHLRVKTIVTAPLCKLPNVTQHAIQIHVHLIDGIWVHGKTRWAKVLRSIFGQSF